MRGNDGARLYALGARLAGFGWTTNVLLAAVLDALSDTISDEVVSSESGFAFSQAR